MNNVTLFSPEVEPSIGGCAWHDALARLGFSQVDGGFRRDDFHLEREAGWLVLRTLAAEGPADFLRDQAACPGLWKWVQDGGRWWRVFEMPARLQQVSSEEELSPGEPFFSALRWALDTAGGAIPQGWHPPSREIVGSWSEARQLTIQADGLLCQGELVLTDRCWAWRFPVVPQLPAGLPKKREKTLQDFLLGSQQDWWMARWAVSGEAGAAGLYAQVDLSGAPPSDALVSAALDGCRFFVQAFAETAALLADPRVEITALADG